MIRNGLMVSAFTLIFAASASAQDGLRRGGQRFMGQQQRHDLYEQQRRREVIREGRDNSVLGPQPWWRTQNWCDANGTLYADSRHIVVVLRSTAVKDPGYLS